MQPFQAARKSFVRARLAALTLAGHRQPRFANLDLAYNASLAPAKMRIKSFLGTLRRLMARRRELR